MTRSQSLDALGFKTYRHYLRSALWKKIRAAVLLASGSQCYCCTQSAACIHHKSYDLAVMRGDDLSMLVPLCAACHKAIEFDIFGNKRSLRKANAALARIRSALRIRRDFLYGLLLSRNRH